MQKHVQTKRNPTNQKKHDDRVGYAMFKLIKEKICKFKSREKK